MIHEFAFDEVYRPGQKVASIRVREVSDVYYTVVVPKHISKNKKAILEWFEEDGRWQYDRDHVDHVKEYAPAIEGIMNFDQCPNWRTGWTDLALPQHGGPKPGETGWHYNGRCHGTKDVNKHFCSRCEAKRKSGNFRLLTDEERQHLTRYPEWSHIRGEFQ